MVKKPTKKEESKEVAKRETTEMTAVPEYLKNARLEQGDIDINDAVLPLIKLMQSNSNEVDCEEPLAESGEFLISSTSENLGTPIFIVPIVVKKKRIKWNPFEEGGGIDCLSQDSINGSAYGLCSACRRKDFGDKGKAPDCTFYFDYLSFAFTEDEVTLPKKGEGFVTIPNALEIVAKRGAAVLSCYMTKLKAARKFNTDILKSGMKPYASIYLIEPEFIKKDPYKWWVFKKLSRVGYIPEDLFVHIHTEIAPLMKSMTAKDIGLERPVEEGMAHEFDGETAGEDGEF